jgi:protein-disulfide isomerase
VAGAQKLVPAPAAAPERVCQHSLPLEDARAQAACGQHSQVGKILEIHQELPGGRELAPAPLDEKADHVRGSPAGHLIIEYGDYQCPYSRQAFHAIEVVEQQLGGNIRFAFRHFPLTRLHWPWERHLLVGETDVPTVVAVTVSGGGLFLVIRGPG